MQLDGGKRVAGAGNLPQGVKTKMGKWKKAKRKPMRGEQEPLVSRLALILGLLDIFLWVTFRGVDIVVISLGSTAVALLGFFLAWSGRKAEGRRRGSLGSSGLTLIAYWGNLVLLLGSFLLFSYTLAMGILRGDFI